MIIHSHNSILLWQNGVRTCQSHYVEKVKRNNTSVWQRAKTMIRVDVRCRYHKREKSATNNNKQANKKQRNYTCTWNSIHFLSKFVIIKYQLINHSTIFRKLLLGSRNPYILRVIGWAQIAISQAHDACAPSLRGHAPINRNATCHGPWLNSPIIGVKPITQHTRTDILCTPGLWIM